MCVFFDTEQTTVCKFIVRATCGIVRRFFVKSDRLLGKAGLHKNSPDQPPQPPTVTLICWLAVCSLPPDLTTTFTSEVLPIFMRALK